MINKGKSYKEYLEQDKLNKISPEKLAPLSVRPKSSKGFGAKDWRIKKNIRGRKI